MSKPNDGETYHGIPVLDLHVGDPIPTPRAPTRYAVRVFPDLARYLLTFNHERNRRIRTRSVRRFSSDMASDLWRFTPASVVLSTTPVLLDGQHRLVSVAESGATVWMILDLGWPDDVITALDHGNARSGADSLAVHGVESSRSTAAVISLVTAYERIRSTDPMRLMGNVIKPSPAMIESIQANDPDGWAESARVGNRMYKALDRSLSGSVWGAAHRIIADARGDAEANAYMDAIRDGRGDPRSATRTIADWARRRPVSRTTTNDPREPLENIIRGYNAHAKGKGVSLVTRLGFELSAVR